MTDMKNYYNYKDRFKECCKFNSKTQYITYGDASKVYHYCNKCGFGWWT